MSFPLFGKNYTATLLNWAPKLTAIRSAVTELLTPLEWGTWEPSNVSGAGTAITRNYCAYFRLFKTVFAIVYLEVTTTAATSGNVIIPLPIEAKHNDSGTFYEGFSGSCYDGGNVISAYGRIVNGTELYASRYDGANWGGGTGRQIRLLGFYRTE